MNEEASDLGGVEFEGALEGGDGGVDVGHGEIVGEGGVAGDLDAVGDVFGIGAAEAGDEDVVDIEDVGELGGYLA